MNENHLAPCRAAPQRFFEERCGGASEEPHLRSPMLPWEGCLLSPAEQNGWGVTFSKRQTQNKATSPICSI